MISPESKEIGNIYREAREKLGLSVEETNERSRIHINVINDIENGVFDRLGKLYLRSFLKKYANFLKLDYKEILEKFENIATKIPNIEFDPDVKSTGRKKTPTVATEKTIQASLVGLFSVIFIVLVIVLVGRVRSKFTGATLSEEAAVVQTKKTAAPTVVKKKVTPAPKKEKKTSIFAKKPAVTLTLAARGEAWVKVTEGRKTLFVGVLRRGNKKTFTAASALTVWTGRAEMLDFTVNKRKLGKIADGVIKNIKVSKEGVIVDDNWVTRF